MTADRGERLTVAGLDGSVTIRRDRYGIAHAQAGSEEDAFFAQGFAHAQDRMWQMDRDRRQAYGTWAAVAGPPALPADRLARKLRLRWVVLRDLEALLPLTRRMVEAYAKGVNAWLAAGAPLPASFVAAGAPPEPWRAEDCLAVFAQRHLAMGGWEAKLWRGGLMRARGAQILARWCAPFALPDTAILSPGERIPPSPGGPEQVERLLRDLAAVRHGGDASNNWAVAGSRTESGLPLLAGDPHRMVEVPNVYYQNHIACPSFDCIGFSMPGVPGMPHFGHNADVAWGITHGMGDTGDVYVQDPKEMEVTHRSTEEIEVRGGARETVDVLWTTVGAVLDAGGDGSSVLALRLPELAEPNPTADAVRQMLSAGGTAELEEAMRSWAAPVQNLVCADRDGHIAYRTRGRLPQRHMANAYVPVPGDDPAYRWRGMVPFEAMPRLADPPCGWLVTANNRTAPPDYPHYVGNDFVAEYRARRIGTLLTGRRGLTVLDMAEIHRDVLSLAAADALPALGNVPARSEAARQALEIMRAWDGRARPDSAAPLLFNAWREILVLRLVRAAWPPARDGAPITERAGAPQVVARLRDHVFALAQADDRRVLEEGASWPALLADSLEQAVGDLAARLGGRPGSWRWDALHRLPAAGSAADGDGPFGFPLPGDPDTVRASSFQPEGWFAVHLASVARYAFDLADWDRSGWVIPHGVAGEADRPHFSDQVEPWREGRLVEMAYSPASVARVEEGRITLDPR